MVAEDADTPRLSRRRFLWLAGAVTAAVTSVGFLAASLLRRGPWLMVVTTVDQQGRVIGTPQVVRIPKPERVARQGLSQVSPYVAKLMTSPAHFTSLAIFTPDGQRGIGLYYTSGQIAIGLHVDWRTQPRKEQAIRRLFSSLRIQPTRDYLAGNGFVPDASRVLEYPLAGDTAKVAEICRRVLREVIGVTDEEALDFTYEEHP